MAQVVLTADNDVATSSGVGGAGAGNHLPVGGYGGADYRSCIRFTRPSGWAAWTITGATLKVYISDHQHVAPKNSSIYCSRQQMSDLWTKGAGTFSCDGGFSASNTTQFADIVSVSADRISFSSGSTANAAKSLNVLNMVKYYQANNASVLPFTFDNNGADQYTELWALAKSGYDATLTIDYTIPVANARPTAPTLGSPANAAVVSVNRPTLSWTHNDPEGDPQANAEVTLVETVGSTSHTLYPATPGDQFVVLPFDVLAGEAYTWHVRTADAVGYGPVSADRTFTVAFAPPVVTITKTRVMAWGGSPGAPRLVVSWATSGPTPAAEWRVETTSPAFDSGWKSEPVTSLRLDGVALVDNVPVALKVSVRTADPTPVVAFDTWTVTPRYGLTTHRTNLGAAAKGWKVPDPRVTKPVGTDVVFEYSSSSGSAPTVWYSTLSSVPLLQYLWWRAWLIPSASAMPSVESISIPTETGALTLDKWGTLPDPVTGLVTEQLVAPWSVDSEYVYGTRSVVADMPTLQTATLWSLPIRLRIGRSYILTGLMKSQLNSGARIQLVKRDGTVLKSTVAGPRYPAGSWIRTLPIEETRDWYTSALVDTYRYSSPVYIAQVENEEVYVTLQTDGVAGSKAWFDGVKLEESTVATPWTPGAVGAVSLDAGGVQVDGSRGGIFRYKGTTGGRATVEGGPSGLLVGGDAELSSPSAGVLRAAGELHVGSPATVGGSGVQLKPEGAVELLWTGGTPYIDFKDASSDDFDARLVMTSPGVLELQPSLTSILKSTGLHRKGGSAFPSVKSTGDTFYRTDLNCEFFWDGTRWLCTCPHVAAMWASNTTTTEPWTGGPVIPNFWYGEEVDLYVERVRTFFRVGTPNNTTNYWTFAFGVGAGTTVDSRAGGVSAVASAVAASGQIIPANAYVNLTASKVGTPGGLDFLRPAFTYRRIAT